MLVRSLILRPRRLPPHQEAYAEAGEGYGYVGYVQDPCRCVMSVSAMCRHEPTVCDSLKSHQPSANSVTSTLSCQMEASTPLMRFTAESQNSMTTREKLDSVRYRGTGIRTRMQREKERIESACDMTERSKAKVRKKRASRQNERGRMGLYAWSEKSTC